MIKEKISDNFITQKDSLILYGIAILLMVFHHCFCLPERLNYDYIPVFFGFETEARLAYIGKLCVAFYAFISGYAFAKKNIHSQKIMRRMFENFKIALSTLIKFYSKFWLVWVIFIPIGIIFFGQPLDLDSIVKSLIFGGGYNGEWWYVYQYLKFLFVFPFIEVFTFCLSNKNLQKRTLLVLISCTVLFILFKNEMFVATIVKSIRTLLSTYMIIFVISFVIGKTNIFEKINNKITLPTSICFVIILLVLVVRWCLVKNPREVRYDILISPILIFSIVTIIHNKTGKESSLLKLLSYSGRYSTYIWLIHTFWIYYFFQDIVLLPRYSILIFIWAFTISLLNAIVLTEIQKKLKIDRLTCNISDYILRFSRRSN